ncbi:helix-turn-helix transcriptional regulator [Streptomyces sp. MBT62]|uniref:helix-turn-helix transcriptional regulator n=1 Tax=Streptomyces sp. MBT62 TaxID=2800410 RepID=UPI00190D5C73|nr:AAA family ATPase [Streptomyces sp. MBT62]MBK3563028.1 AAA family ATPase [Streptomyces sp. MBT62]
MDRGILEREPELVRLATAAREAADGAGSVALVLGEAGIGKSSLVRAMPERLPQHTRILLGQCDDLATRRPLGPFRDLIGSVGAELARAVMEGGDRHRVYEALLGELSGVPHPAVLVVEDVHWADEASLDALRFLVRRMAQLPAVLVLTYRDDELSREHPLRHLLGQVSRADRVHRLPLARLSKSAVHTLSSASSLDPAQVYEVTSGNPFFVTEILAAGGTGSVPPTVVDAVLARLRGLDGRSVDALEQLAVVPSAVERTLVDTLLADGVAGLAAAEQRGLLTVTPERVAFRHELIRRAVADSLPAARRIELDRRVLTALVARPGSDPARIVHHAARAGDQDAIARYGPAAARDATEAGAHREAAAHLRLVLRQRHRYTPAELADLLERYAVECYTLADSVEAVAAQRDAVALRRSLGDTLALGADLRWLSRIQWWAGHAEEARDAAREAIAVLEHAGDDRLLALALSNTAQLRMLSDRFTEAIAHGERAIALARRVDDPAILAHALNNVGSARWRSGDPDGRRQLEESLAVALAAGEVEHACRSYANIIWTLLDNLQYAEADRFLPPAMELADRAEHLGFLNYLHVEQAMRRLAAADWEEAERHAEYGMHEFVPARCPALTVLARVRVRCGRPGADEPLTQAWEIAVGTGELQRTGPVAAVRAEAAWLRGDHAAAAEAAGPVHAHARSLGYGRYRAELGYWLSKAGQPPVPADDSDHPYALQAAGEWKRAADLWQQAGCPYEHAAALAESPDPADRLTALAQLDALGAEPLARLVRAELRRLGVSHVPRGPHAATRGNPAGLTDRQLQVVRLLVDGLTNPEIADRLVVSVRTVDNHVRAVLEKLDAPTRRQAAARAAELGLPPYRET